MERAGKRRNDERAERAMKLTRHWRLWQIALLAALLASAFLSLGFGSTDVGLSDAWRVIRHAIFAGGSSTGSSLTPASAGGTAPGDPAAGVILQIRLPRTLLALLAGGLLAIAGVIMQAFFRNPLADPYLVGVSSGAALGAVLAMLLGWGLAVGGLSPVPLSAFLFAIATVAVVYLVNRRPGGLRTEGLLLSGIAIASAISAIVALLLVTSEHGIQEVLFWLLGSLASARWAHVLIVLPYGVLGLVLTLLLARDLDLLLWGDVTSAALGAHVARTRTLLLGAASLMTAAVVAVSGVIGFVGLMVPHLARGLMGSAHRRLIPAAAMLGGLLLLWADVLARTLRAPTELPLGAITSIVGAPFLVYLCSARGRKRW
jgi:iron complex transport system permease protein